MCTYETQKVTLQGSAKSGSDWFKAKEATVYFDHPVSAPYEHSLNVDVFGKVGDEHRRVALELSPQSARELALSIIELLDSYAPSTI